MDPIRSTSHNLRVFGYCVIKSLFEPNELANVNTYLTSKYGQDVIDRILETEPEIRNFYFTPKIGHLIKCCLDMHGIWI